ncbi:MAG: hypothetical protein JXL97_02360 [Bacteroidales bacterium]|nr:hypothetical protein [Bacteroidales bacterium]
MTFLIIAIIIVLIIVLAASANKKANDKVKEITERHKRPAKSSMENEFASLTPKDNFIKIKYSDFQKHLGQIPDNIFDISQDAILNGQNHFFVDKNTWDNITKKTDNRNKWESDFSNYQELIKEAKSYEDLNNWESAIKMYEEALRFGKQGSLNICNFAHCIDRLLILYRRTKQRDKEIELLLNSLEENKEWEHSTYDKWNERLTKLI